MKSLWYLNKKLKEISYLKATKIIKKIDGWSFEDIY